MPKALKHLHTFIRDKSRTRTRATGVVTFKCTDPKCWFYAVGERILGKAAICPYCGQEYVVTRFDLQLKRPHCKNCTTSKKKQQEKQELTGLEKLINDLLEKK